MSRFTLGVVLLSQIIWFIVMTAGNNYIFGIRNVEFMISYFEPPFWVSKYVKRGAFNASVVSMLTILLPAAFNIAVLSYWLMKNDSKVDEYVENTVSKSMYIGYFPLVVTGFLAKGLITN
jgi:hypothetical protein